MSERTHCYVGFAPECGCARVMIVDDPAYKKDTAKDVARAIKDGYEVRRVTWDEMHEAMRRADCPQTPCPNPRNKKAMGA